MNWTSSVWAGGPSDAQVRYWGLGVGFLGWSCAFDEFGGHQALGAMLTETPVGMTPNKEAETSEDQPVGEMGPPGGAASQGH